MRPDAVNWKNTNDLAALEFSPRHMIHRRIVRWIALAIALHTAAAMLVWVGLQAAPAFGGGASPTTVTATATAATAIATSAATAGRVPAQPSAAVTDPGADPTAGWTTRVLAVVHQPGLRRLLVAQLIAFLVTQILVVPLIQAAIRSRTRGLRELFEAIRHMASGLTPKPLPAGRPGEAGYLALAFNDMASKLMASRRDLVEANQTLERRVEERTRELRDAAAKLEHMASTDALTGLANRRALAEEGQDLFAAAVRQDADLVCCLIDLDNFKKVNDTLGHKAGDELIQAAAETLRRGCGQGGLCARLGGDEFTLVIPGDDLSRAASLAEQLQQDFARRVDELFGSTAPMPKPSMSIGITSRKQSESSTFEELVTRADAALYRAKERGKGRAEVDGAAAVTAA